MQSDTTTTATAVQGTTLIQLPDFLRLILPEEGVKCWVTIKNKKVRQFFADSIDGLAAGIEAAAKVNGVDVYFACAGFKDKSSRKGVNALGAQSFWLDLDAGTDPRTGQKKEYENSDAALNALDDFCVATGLPYPVIVQSGYGIHAYWPLDRMLPVAEWKPHTNNLKRLTEKHGLKVDHSRTTDIASILRPPGTHNWKAPNNPIMVYVQEFKGENISRLSADKFIDCLDKANCVSASASAANANILSGLSGTPDFKRGYPDGERTAALAHRAGHLLAKGHDVENVLAQCRAWNQYNTPPKDDTALEHDVRSYAKREAEKQKAAALTPELESEMKRLAGLPLIQYDQQRAAIAEKLGIRVTTLDASVDGYREKQDGPAKSGTALSLPMPAPWQDEVDGAELLDGIATEIKRYIILPDDAAADAMALWVVHAHVFEVFHITPRLTITSPEKRCGKTRVLEVLNELTPRPLLSANVTPAAMFRTIEAMRPTLLIDEADTFATDKSDIRGIVNSGYMRNGQVIRTVGDDHEPRCFSTWSPAAFAAIGRLPDTIEDRSVIISMRRRKAGEKVKSFRTGKVGELGILARKAARWVIDNAARLQDAEPAAPPELNDRAADCWYPLFAIAEIAGGKWPERARQAALHLSGVGVLEDQSVKVQLLTDIREMFKTRDADKLPSGELCQGLQMMEDRPWGDWSYGKSISQRQLAGLLAPFGIKSKDIRVKNALSKDDKEKTVKGYELAQFADALSRYL